MEEIKFKSLNELYTRLYPAFNTKKNELNQKGIDVREIDLWNFLKENLWSINTHLSIYDMVNDILSVNEDELKNYINKTK